MSVWRTTVGIRMVSLRKTAEREIILDLEKLARHCKGQDYPKMRFPETPMGQGFGTRVERWVQ